MAHAAPETHSMSNTKHIFFRGRPETTAASSSRFYFRDRLSDTATGQLRAQDAFWTGDWRLAIAEERVAMAEERLARALERWKKSGHDISS